MESYQKLCKECGLPFTPNGREKYCTREHYRPCPVCSKPVLIKYLSDPTPCCSKECSKVKRSGARKIVPKQLAQTFVSSATQQGATQQGSTPNNKSIGVHYEKIETRKYISKDGVMGLKTGHIYSIEINQEVEYNTYKIHVTYDHTSETECDIHYASGSLLNFNKNCFAKID